MFPREPKPCGDCAVAPGALHVPGCDVERCALCGDQAIGCYCIYEVCGIGWADMEEKHPDIFNNGPTEAMRAKFDAEVERFGGRLPWTGIWPGVEVCQELGLFCVSRPIDGVWHVPCGSDHPQATEDLNLVRSVAKWDKELRRWVPFHVRLTKEQLGKLPFEAITRVESLDDLQYINDVDLPDGSRTWVRGVKRAVLFAFPRWTSRGMRLPDVDYIHWFPTLSGKNRWSVT